MTLVWCVLAIALLLVFPAVGPATPQKGTNI